MSKKSTQYVKTFSSELVTLMHNKDMATSSDLNQNEMESNMPFPFCIVFHTFNKSFFQGKQFC